MEVVGRNMVVLMHNMRQVPLEHDINIAISGPFWVEVANPEHPFTAMLISCSRGSCLIAMGLGPLGISLDIGNPAVT